ncbi:adenylyltransferase/cytidyltransferase family protein [Tissierellaceae bacterium HCP3S3_D8]
MFFSDELNTNNEKEVLEIKEFLDNYGVDYDCPDKTFVIRDSGKIIATGSASGNILKYFFSKEEYKGQGAMGIIYNSLLSHLLEEGYDSFFVFTSPNNRAIFQSLGLKEVYSTERVSLFEGGFYNYNSWIHKIKSNLKPKIGRRGAIIMNCNPMTLGHKYLIRRAVEEVDELLIFVVEEDKSVFPFKDRFSILQEELKDIEKIDLIKGGPYIISQGTFPTYFIKKKDEMLEIYTELDGSIFADKIAKDLGIDIRFLGSEPKDMVTLAYNKSLKEILEKRDIEVKIIPRMSLKDEIVSASYVRQLLKEGKMKEAFNFLPNSTIEYLKSDRGQKIISRL